MLVYMVDHGKYLLPEESLKRRPEGKRGLYVNITNECPCACTFCLRTMKDMPADMSLWLGGKEPTTLKALSEALGRETIDTYNTGESRGRETSHSLNYQKLGKSLLSVDELEVLDGGKCILQLRGVRPFLSSKYDITKHPHYKYLSDADPKNAFDVERFIRRRMKVKADTVTDVYEVDAEENGDELSLE